MRIVKLFQFHLSTWLLLVTLLCWAMAQRPYWEAHRRIMAWPVDTDRRYATVVVDQPRIEDWRASSPDAELLLDRLRSDRRVNLWQDGYWRPNPRLLWPAVTLAALLCWKGLRADA